MCSTEEYDEFKVYISMAYSLRILAQASLCREIQDLWVQYPVPLITVSELEQHHWSIRFLVLRHRSVI
jgi:hypothetical protein